MRCTSHLLVIWEAKSRILFSKYTQTMPPCKVSDIFWGMQYGVHRILTEKLVSKRFVQCIIPFISWAFLLPILKNGIWDLSRTVNTLLYPDNGLWFLYNLFFYCVMVSLSERWASERFKQECLLLILVAFSYVLMAILHTKLNATQICWYFPFFAMGYYMRKYPSLRHKKKLTICIVGGVSFDSSILDDARRTSFLSLG